MTKAEITTYAQTMISHYGLEGWGFRFNNRRRSIGRCIYSEKVIELSKLWADGDDVDIKDTILHEIAHALTPGHGHDKVWKAMCVKVGAKPNRCSTEKQSPSVTPRYVAVAENGEIIERWFRKPNERTIKGLANRTQWYRVAGQKVFCKVVEYKDPS